MTGLDDVGFVTEWFQDRLGGAVGGVSVHSVRRVSRGVSRETWIVDANVSRAGATSPESFIVRRDPPEGTVIPIALREEYEVYRRLAHSDVPLARPLWFEEAPERQPDGRPAYVRTLVDGHWRLPFLTSEDPADDERKIAASKEHLDKLATVHTTDWRALGFDEIGTVPTSPEECASALLDDVEAWLDRYQLGSSPVVAEALSQLRSGAPRDAPCIALCKGTNGHGEEVWSDGRIVAMSDWELWRLGDPAYDFAQLQDLVPEIIRDGRRKWGWPEALDHYAARSGIEISERRLHYYRACYGLVQFCYAQHSAHLVRNGARGIRLAWNGTEVQYRAQLKLAAACGFAAG